MFSIVVVVEVGVVSVVDVVVVEFGLVCGWVKFGWFWWL